MEYVVQMMVFWVVTPRGIVWCCIDLNQTWSTWRSRKHFSPKLR